MTRFSSHTSTLALSAALMLTASIAQAKDRIVVLSDTLPPEAAKVSYVHAMSVMGATKPGDSVTFMNGPTGEIIGKVEVPEGQDGEKMLRYKQLKAKAFGPTINRLKGHFKSAMKSAETLPKDAVSMQVNFAQTLGTLAYFAKEEPQVIVLGSSRFYDPRLPDYSMAHSFPNEAHWMYEPSATPFGAGGRAGTLEGVQIHFCDLDAEHVKPMQLRGLHKAIGLQVQGHGAELATISTSVKTCVTRAISGDASGMEVFEWNGRDKAVKIYDALLTGEVAPRQKAEQIKQVGGLPISDADKSELIAQITTGSTVLAEVELHDTDSEDGDVVALVSGSVRINVALRKKPQRVFVPIRNGKLTMEGVRDGGGGITVGVRTKADDRLRSPVMKVGQQIALPFVTS
ncbi:MAG: hypothetical protein AAGD04_03570 [Pseudomonadota bacterium]